MTRSVRNTVIFGPVLQLMVVVAASRVQLPLEVFYILLLAMLGLQVYFFERDNPKERVVDTAQYTLGEAPRQVLAGALIGIVAGIPAIVWGTPRFDAASFPADVLTQAIFVAFVETIYLLVVVNTLYVGDVRIGIVIWPPLFGLLHVREEVLHGTVGTETVLRFVYAAVFGALFWLLYEGREILPKPTSKFFGAVTSWTAHLTVNLIVIAFLLQLWGLELFALVSKVIGHG